MNLSPDYIIVKVLSQKISETIQVVKHKKDDRKQLVRKVLLENTANTKLEVGWELKLENPFIVRYLDVIVKPDHYELIYKFFERGTLKNIFTQSQKKGRVFSKNTVHGIFAQLCYGLEFLHKNGIVHRGVRISNVFVEEDGKLALGEYGKLVSPDGTAKSTTQTQTPTEIDNSPEELKGEKLTYKSDIYQLGAVMYYLTSGVRPFECKAVYLAVKKKLDGKYNEYKHLIDYDKEMENLFLSMMELNPNKRPTSSDLVKHPLIKDTMKRLQNINAYTPIDATNEIPKFFTVGLIYKPEKQAEILRDVAAMRSTTREDCKTIFSEKFSFLLDVFSEADDEDGEVTINALKKMLEVVLILAEGSNEKESTERLTEVESKMGEDEQGKNLLYYLHHLKREASQIHVALVHAVLYAYKSIDELIITLPYLFHALDFLPSFFSSSSSSSSSSSPSSSPPPSPSGISGGDPLSPFLQPSEMDEVFINNVLRVVALIIFAGERRSVGEKLHIMRSNGIVPKIRALCGLTSGNYASTVQLAKQLLAKLGG